MRRASLLALGILFAAHFLSAQNLQDGLVFYAPFDGNTVNLVDWVKPVNTGASLVADKFGNANKAMHFDGDNDLLDYGNIVNLDKGNFTISVWVKVDHYIQGERYGQGAKILNKGLGESGYDDFRGFGIRAVNFNDSGNNLRFMTAAGSNEDFSPNVQFTDSHGLAEQEWYHLIATRAGAITQLYLNGELLINGIASTIADLSTEQFFTLGGLRLDNNNTAEHFAGTLDEVRIYNRRLSALEIEVLHKAFVGQSSTANIVDQPTIPNNQLSVFPNPTTRLLNVDFADALDRRIEIVDAAGRNMFYGRFNEKRAAINVAGLPPGIYFLRIQEGDRVTIKKFVKQGVVLP